MDDFTETARSGVQEVAERIRPAAASDVRGRGDRLRRRRTTGVTALALAGFVAVGGVLAATHRHRPVSPGGEYPTMFGGSSSSQDRQDSPTGSTPSQSSGSVTPGTSQTQESTGTPYPGQTPHPCETRDLTVSTGGWIGASGHTYGVFAFKNAGSTACRMSGYPKVTGVNGKGVVTATAADVLNGWAADRITSIPTVDIPPGGYASAGVEWEHFDNSGNGQCPVVTDFEVAPPSGGIPARVPLGPGLTSGGTDGAACSSFWIHPVIAGVNPWYFQPPYTYPPGASAPSTPAS